MVSHFEALLNELVAKEMGVAVVPAGMRAQLHAALDDNGFRGDDNVPRWLARFFRALLEDEVLPLMDCPSPMPTDGDVSELFQDLQDVEALSCYDHGEWVRIRLRSMLGFVSTQHSNCAVLSLTDIPDDAGSDISDAKRMDRS